MKTDFMTRQPVFLETLRLLKYVARETPDPILLIGPAGVGKRTLAWNYGSEKTHFFEWNCATKPTLENALQVFEKAQTTIFLREIDFLTPEAQAQILDLLDEEPQMRVWASITEKKGGTKSALRPDLQAALNIWTFQIPGLAQRSEDLPELIKQELKSWSKRMSKTVSFTEESKKKFLRFASSPEAVWACNFRDLHASIARMASLAIHRSSKESISTEIVAEEIARLKSQWSGLPPVVRTPVNIEEQAQNFAQKVLGQKRWNELDRFDRSQIVDVLWVCSQSQNFSDAGRVLFSHSRLEKKTFNDSDRMRKFLLKFGITWNDIQNCKASEEAEK